MPKAAKNLTSRRPKSQPIICRLSNKDTREQYRRRVFGGPGPIDCWICANCANMDDSSAPLADGEVQCTIRVQRTTPVEDGSGFVDPDIYSLHLTIATPPVSSVAEGPSVLRVHPSIVLETYQGWKNSLSAPEWTRRKPGRDLVFRQSQRELSLLFSRVASRRINVEPLVKQLDSMKLV